MIFIFIHALVFVLSGCNPDAGKIKYEIIYPSGNKIPPEESVHERAYPIEDSELELKWEEAGKEMALQLIDKDGRIISEYWNLPSGTARGSKGEDGILWICTEDWKTVHRDGYLDSTLEKSTVMQVDAKSGKVIFTGNAGADELCLGYYGDKAYFYYRGLESEKKLLGFIQTEPQNAEIFYRDVKDWVSKQNVYTFDYIEKPYFDHNEKDTTNTLRFYLNGSLLRVTLEVRSYMNSEWKNNGKWSVEIPLE